MKTLLSSVVFFCSLALAAQPILIHDYPFEPNDSWPTETGDSIWLATNGGVELLTNFGANTNIFHPSFEAHKITKTTNALWFGGKDSIARYDGTQWTFFKSGLPASFMVNDIKAVNGVIWVVANQQLYRMLGNGFIDMNREALKIVSASIGNRFVLVPRRRNDDHYEFNNGSWTLLPSLIGEKEFTYVNQTLWVLRPMSSSALLRLDRVNDEWLSALNLSNSSNTIFTFQGKLYAADLRSFWEINTTTETVVDSFSVFYNFRDRMDTRSISVNGSRVICHLDGNTGFSGIREILIDAAQYEDKKLDINGFEWPVNPVGAIGRNNFTFDDVKIDGKPAIFAINPWVTGSVLNSDFANAPMYGQFNSLYASGPSADVHNKEYVNKYNKVWKVSRDEIEYHKDNFNDNNYVIPEDIATWPGNGDHTNGEAFHLAPFVDVNGNGIYEPEEGDYPDILGHQAVYTISNNVRNDFLVGGNFDFQQRKIEVHLMMYAFDSAEVPELNNTTFLNYRLFNRGNQTWDDAKFTLFNDWGMQNPFSSVCGSDSIDNLFFGYNISGFDPVFGPSPVAVVGSLLNQPLEGHIYFFNSSFGGISMLGPRSVSDVMSYVNFFRNRPIPFVRTTTGGPNSNDNGLGNPPGLNDTTTSFSPTSWAFNSPDNWYFPPAEQGDVRSLAVTEIGDVQPGEHRCLEFGFTHGYDETDVSGDWQQALARARSTMNTAKTVYDNLNTGCLGAVLSNDVFEDNRVSFNLFPNPVSSGQNVRIETNDRLEYVTLISTSGTQMQLMIKKASNGYDITMPENLAAGAYLLNIQTARKGMVTEKILVP